MDNRRTRLIQTSFALIVPKTDQVADLFYARLFELEPTLRPLFKHSLQEQKRKLIDMLVFIVDHLLALDALIPAVQMLGRRHLAYGVQAKDYEPVQSALMWALEQSMGPAFTPEVRSAWIGVYTMLANIMLRAAKAEADE